MDVLKPINDLISQGRFCTALNELQRISIGPTQRTAADILKSELLEQVGHHSKSRALAEHLLSKSLPARDRSACEFTIARILLDAGDTESALRRFQRARSLAEEAGDLERLCWSQIRLLTTLAERSTTDATASLLSDVRMTAIKTGSPQLLAAVHLYVGEMDAKRGLLANGKRHISLGQELLSRAPNVWMEAVAENTLLAIAVLRNDFEKGLAHGHRALEFAEQSGSATTLRACLGNLGNLNMTVGNFDKAIDYFERAIDVLPTSGPNTNANLDSLARIRLLQGDTEACSILVNRIDESIQAPSDRALYANRYAQLTKTHLAIRQKKWTEALSDVDSVLALAARTEDSILKTLGILTKAEIFQEVGDVEQCLTTLDSVVHEISGQHPEICAHYERVLASVLAGRDDTKARRHFERARRICASVHNGPGLVELDRHLTSSHDEHGAAEGVIGTETSESFSVAQHVVQTVATLMLHTRRPEVLTSELIQLLRATECVKGAIGVVRNGSQDPKPLVLVRSGSVDFEMSSSKIRRLIVSADVGVTHEILVRPNPDIESHATLNAIELLLHSIHDLERARADREERATLWPADDPPADSGDAVITGHMRELIGLARRIGPTNVTVLITGESGTGKEILARAIHACSSRAARPLVPFNCAAIPREMLESQLFGHRRGAFTGADRDQPGVIRAARDGTLFLDEIGEMSLDLQPKLLRFLESGEIAPLGEPGPLTVDVRVVAATNANLETLVREGRFREDLFYRINVFRLAIRPLRERRDEIPALVNAFVARAAAEFRKGHLTVAEETMEHLLLYPWPGNVRQLLNEVRRIVALAEPNATLVPTHISSEIRAVLPAFPTLNADTRQIAVRLRDKLTPTLSKIECEMIRLALRDNGGKVDAAARALGISRKGLYLKRQRLGL